MTRGKKAVEIKKGTARKDRVTAAKVQRAITPHKPSKPPDPPKPDPPKPPDPPKAA